MLPLIPALLLLALHGPSGLERLSHDGKLPKALRVLERVLATAEAGRGPAETSSMREGHKRAFRTLASMTSDPAFSQAVWKLYELTIEFHPEDSEPDSLDLEPPRTQINLTGFRVQESVRDGYLQNRRTRAGPKV